MPCKPMAIEQALEVCELIAEGDSVANACKSLGLLARAFYKTLATGDEELGQNYVRARKSRADTRAERIDEIMECMTLVKNDPRYIDPNTARVMIDAIKWQAAKENHSRYGDKIAVEEVKPRQLLNRTEQLQQIRDSGLDLVEISGVWAIPVNHAEAEPAENSQAVEDTEVVDL